MMAPMPTLAAAIQQKCFPTEISTQEHWHIASVRRDRKHNCSLVSFHLIWNESKCWNRSHVEFCESREQESPTFSPEGRSGINLLKTCLERISNSHCKSRGLNVLFGRMRPLAQFLFDSCLWHFFSRLISRLITMAGFKEIDHLQWRFSRLSKENLIRGKY